MLGVSRRGIQKELLHHSDQGSRYTSESFQRMLKDLGIKCSLSRRGECHDNAVMESFYGSMKTEKLYREQYKKMQEAKAAVFDYIEGFYNPHRRHSTLGKSAQLLLKNRRYVLYSVSGILGTGQLANPAPQKKCERLLTLPLRYLDTTKLGLHLGPPRYCISDRRPIAVWRCCQRRHEIF